MRRIDADELIKKLERQKEIYEVYQDWKSVKVILYDINEVKNMKTVKHGFWIAMGVGIYRCSECKHEWRLDPMSSFKYCPDCGAKMTEQTG